MNNIDKAKELECANESCHKKIKYGAPIWIDYYNESCVFCSAECYADTFGATKFELGQREDDDYNSFFADIAADDRNEL